MGACRGNVVRRELWACICSCTGCSPISFDLYLGSPQDKDLTDEGRVFEPLMHVDHEGALVYEFMWVLTQKPLSVSTICTDLEAVCIRHGFQMRVYTYSYVHALASALIFQDPPQPPTRAPADCRRTKYRRYEGVRAAPYVHLPKPRWSLPLLGGI